MTFFKYPKIESPTSSRIDRLLNQHPTAAQNQWVAQEKLHGANIQISKNNRNEFALASRAGPTTFDFYNAHEAFENKYDDLDELFNKISEEVYVPPTQISLCGELYGKGINNKLNYGNEIKFALFDFMIDGRIFEHTQALMESEYFVPHIEIGTLEDLLKNIDIENLKSDYTVNDDLAEGVVLKPVLPLIDKGTGSNIMFKKKRKAFIDKKNKSNSIESRPVLAPTTDAESVWIKTEPLISNNRLIDLFSKHGKIEDESQIDYYVNLFVDDVIDDIKSKFTPLNKKERNFVTKRIKIKSLNLIKSYLCEESGQ